MAVFCRLVDVTDWNIKNIGNLMTFDPVPVSNMKAADAPSFHVNFDHSSTSQIDRNRLALQQLSLLIINRRKELRHISVMLELSEARFISLGKSKWTN